MFFLKDGLMLTLFKGWINLNIYIKDGLILTFTGIKGWNFNII